MRPRVEFHPRDSEAVAKANAISSWLQFSCGGGGGGDDEGGVAVGLGWKTLHSRVLIGRS